MANAIVVQTLEDGPRNAVVKASFELDTSDLAATVIYDPAAGYQDPSGTQTTRVSIWEAQWSVQTPLVLRLQWKATTNAEALALWGSEKANYRKYGGIRNNAGAGVNGQLIAITNGWVTPLLTGYVILRLTKGN
jgi:hypothetical protein